MAGQMGWAGFSSAHDVHKAYSDAALLCQTNYALRDESDTVSSAISAGVVTENTMKQLRDTVNTWDDRLQSLKQQALDTRNDYIAQFTYFLFFLAFTTTMFFFALEKKGGRLNRLFAKIDKIEDFTD